MLKRGELFALWMAVAVPVVYFSAPADAVNCYHGSGPALEPAPVCRDRVVIILVLGCTAGQDGDIGSG